MFRFRPWLECVATLCVWVLCIFALSSKLGATPPLTTISDTLFNADGTYFNGVVIISWPSFEASDTSNVAAGTDNIPVSNGILYVQLVPTTNADTAAVYTVQYTSFGRHAVQRGLGCATGQHSSICGCATCGWPLDR